MIQSISIEEYLKERHEFVLIDVRSEKEYMDGHVSGAINIPILNNDERKIVGTLYKQKSRQTAVYKGLELTGPHLSGRLKKGAKYAKDKKILIHCWRGGMRSEFYAFLLHYLGLEPFILKGGYKSYRAAVHRTFHQKIELVVLSGKTGSSKTEVLALLRDLGEQVIDLEFLAKHRGSSFGALAFEDKPSQEQFENDLFEILNDLDLKKRVWIEDENRTIGDKVVPEPIWSQFKMAPKIIIDRTFEERLDQIFKDYGQFKVSDLKDAMLRIGKRLGPQHVKNATDLLEQGLIREAFEIALRYYDKAYDYQLSSIEKSLIHRFDGKGKSLKLISKEISKIEWA